MINKIQNSSKEKRTTSGLENCMKAGGSLTISLMQTISLTVLVEASSQFALNIVQGQIQTIAIVAKATVGIFSASIIRLSLVF